MNNVRYVTKTKKRTSPISTRAIYRYNSKNTSRQLPFSKTTMSLIALPLCIVAIFAVTNRQGTSDAVSRQGTETEQRSPLQHDQPQQYALKEASSSIAWPKQGSAAIGIYQDGIHVHSPNDTQKLPMASLAKVMTALAITEKHPLNNNDELSIQITSADEQLYSNYYQKGGSVLPVKAGQTISLREILEGMLIKSANNYAETAVNQVFGSEQAYAAYANDFAERIGLHNSTFTDSTGFSPETTATAQDLVRLGSYFMQDKELATIAGTWQAKTPSGTITNTNRFLDFEENGVIGIKTGLTDEAGGTYLMAAKRTIAGDEVIFIVSVLGGKNHFSAQESAITLLNSVENSFEKKN